MREAIFRDIEIESEQLIRRFFYCNLPSIWVFRKRNGSFFTCDEDGDQDEEIALALTHDNNQTAINE